MQMLSPAAAAYRMAALEHHPDKALRHDRARRFWGFDCDVCRLHCSLPQNGAGAPP